MVLGYDCRLILQDGSVFFGKSFGFEKNVSGEVVFNTGMVGYPESMTDPSYRGQILAFTYPLIGNYGVPGKENDNGLLKNFESDMIQAKAVMVSDYSFSNSHWNSKKSLQEWLIESQVPGIYGIDTRALTKRLREKGTMLGKIVFGNEDIPFTDPNAENLVDHVSTKDKIVYGSGATRVLLIDCGVKYNIIRCLLKRGVRVIRIPWDFDFSEEQYEGIIISNGPGDPKMCTRTIAHIRAQLENETPIFGICLGNQILALASGADTYKLKYGHRSQNQPVLLAGTNRCYITSQNHGYAVDTKTLGKDWDAWFTNANDMTNEGIRHKTKPFFSVQFHPEATCGPVDTEFLFDDFIKVMEMRK
jgi:carbamoyl-phosphate synthase small subunit